MNPRSLWLLALLLVAALGLAGCDDPPCPAGQTAKAAATYTACLEMTQHGDGGFRCGKVAYDMYCRKETTP